MLSISVDILQQPTQAILQSGIEIGYDVRMARTRKLTGSHLLKGLLALSVVSCFALPRGLDRPRELVAPLLAPISHGGTYICDTVGRNLTDLLGGDCDEQTARDILTRNPRLRRQLTDATAESLQRQLTAYEQLIAQQRSQLAEMAQARLVLRDDFPCKLVPATVIGGDAGPYSRSRLLRPSGRSAPGDPVTTRDVLTNRPTAIPETVAALSGEALIGRIVSSGGWTAHVQLITDPDFRTRAMVLRLIYPDRRRRIMVAEPDDGRTLFVSRDLQPGDPAIPVYLSGQGTGMISAAGFHATVFWREP